MAISISKCSTCKKPLSDPQSVLRGIGPVCWAERLKKYREEKTSNLFGNRAEFSWGIDGKNLWIKDNGTTCRSLTNDMENALVLIQIELGNQSIAYYDIVYKDSDGFWDGVKIIRFDMKQVLADAQFLTDSRYKNYMSFGIEIDFYYIGEKTYEAAKQKVK